MQKQTHNNAQKTDTQKQWKTLFIILGFCLILGLGYFISVILRNEESSIPNPSVISSETRNPASVITIHTGIQSASASGTKELPPCNLINPFSGSTDCKKEEKPKFVKPNTEWKTRTLSGITYVFGEGNPKEVAIDQSQVKIGDGYVTAETEGALKALLESDEFTYILNKCYDVFDIGNIDTTKNNWEKFPPNLDMETMLIINPETKRKEINNIYLAIIEPAFSYLMSPVGDTKNPLRTCIGEDFIMAIKIEGRMSVLNKTYLKGE